MEMHFYNDQSRQIKRITRIKELADKINISFEEAEMIVNELHKRVGDPKKRVNNIVSLDDVVKTIVTRAFKELDFHMDNRQLTMLHNLVKDELKTALKRTKMIDVAKERIENQELKKQLAEFKKDRERLKSALESSISAMVVYADPKGNIAAEQKIDGIRKSAGEALRLSDALDYPAEVKPAMFFFGMDMGR